MAKRRKYDDDDGRVIANMNVDGMPWYMEKAKKKEASSQELDLTKEEATKKLIDNLVKELNVNINLKYEDLISKIKDLYASPIGHDALYKVSSKYPPTILIS